MSQQIQEIKINPDYFKLVPRPNPEQRKALKESIERDGQLEPIVLDSEGVILDGHTRYEICKELGIEPKYVIKDKFLDEQDKQNYIIIVNLKRRHLNDFQIFELFEKQINLIASENQAQRNRNIWLARKGGAPLQTYEIKKENTTMKKAQDLTTLPAKTVELCRFLKKHGDSKIIQEVREGKVGIHRAGYNVKQKLGSLRTYNVKHSKMGMVIDIVKAISENKKVNKTIIQKSTNVNSYTVDHLLELLEKNKLLIKKVHSYKTKQFNRTAEFTSYHLTRRGNMFFEKYRGLERYLPKELWI